MDERTQRGGGMTEPSEASILKHLSKKEENRRNREITRRYMAEHVNDGETRAGRAERTSILGRVAEWGEINKSMDRQEYERR